MLIVNLLILFASTIVLARSSLFLVRSLVNIAAFFRLTEFSVAFILMALATSLPEIFVGISAALENAPTLVLGNVVGSNIVDLTLVFGVVILVSGGLYSKSVIAKRDSLYMMMFSSAPIMLMFDGMLSRGDAVILMIFYSIYIMRLLDQRKSFHETETHVTSRDALQSFLIFMVGALLLIFSAQVLVYAAKNLADILGFSVGLVGLFIVALGTSLPELAFELQAIKKHEDSLVLGDLIGSVVTNSTLVLAITALFRPIIIPDITVYATPTLFLAVILVLFEVVVRQDKKLGLVEGLLFLFIYVFFLISEVGVGITLHIF